MSIRRVYLLPTFDAQNTRCITGKRIMGLNMFKAQLEYCSSRLLKVSEACRQHRQEAYLI